MSLWNLGRRLWSATITVRLGVPWVMAALVLLVATGPGGLFWSTVVVGGSVLAGARLAINDLTRRENGVPDRK